MFWKRDSAGSSITLHGNIWRAHEALNAPEYFRRRIRTNHSRRTTGQPRKSLRRRSQGAGTIHIPCQKPYS